MKRRLRLFFTVVGCLALLSGGVASAAEAPSPLPAAAGPPASPVAAPEASPSAAPRPQFVSHWDFVDDESFPIEVRRGGIVESGGYVVVSATVDGKPGSFLLDTGSGSIILTQRFAESLNLQALGTTHFHGIAGNSIAAGTAVVRNLAFGKSVLHDIVVDISSYESAGLNRHLDGIVGYGLFAKAIVDVDLSDQRMRVYDPARFEPTVTKKSYIFDIDISHRQPQISGEIGSGIPIHPIFDTGNALLLSLSDALRDGNRLVATHATTLSFSGVDGRTDPVDCARVNRATFGPINYDGPIVCFFKPGVFAKDGGLIGFDFLEHFNWTIDYPDKKFVLTPNGM